MTTTAAAVLVELGAPLELLELEIPRLSPGQALVDIAFSGVCHSQLNEWRGLRGPDAYLPHALGHEASGTVLEVGPDVDKVAVGDRVVLSWLRGAGHDVPGTTYGSEIGPVNAGGVTTFMRQAVVSENRLVRIPETLDLRTAALLGCAVPTGAGAVINNLALQAGESIAVFGCGGIGLMAVMAAASIGAPMIIAIDVRPERLQAALAAGATHTVDASGTDAVVRIRELTGGAGVDAALEAAGTTATMQQALVSAREHGGRAVLAGNPPAGETIAIDPFDLIRGRHVTGSWGGDTDIDRDIPRYVDMVTAGQLPVAGIIGTTFPLEKVNEALADLASGGSTRPMLEL